MVHTSELTVAGQLVGQRGEYKAIDRARDSDFELSLVYIFGVKKKRERMYQKVSFFVDYEMRSATIPPFFLDTSPHLLLLLLLFLTLVRKEQTHTDATNSRIRRITRRTPITERIMVMSSP